MGPFLQKFVESLDEQQFQLLREAVNARAKYKNSLLPGELSGDEIADCMNNDLIHAIKKVRDRTALTLRESKCIVDAWIASHR